MNETQKLTFPGRTDLALLISHDTSQHILHVQTLNQAPGLRKDDWFTLYHSVRFSTKTMQIAEVIDTVRQKIRQTPAFMPGCVQILLEAFSRMFGRRKRLTKDEWSVFCRSLQDFEQPRFVGYARFYRRTGEQVLAQRHCQTLTPAIDPTRHYWQGADWAYSVYVEPAYQRQGIASAMYRVASTTTGLAVVPARCLSPAAMALHRAIGTIG